MNNLNQNISSNNTSTAPSTNQSAASSSTASNLFTLTNSVKSIGSAYEQNILAAKTALRSPFKSISNDKNSNKSIVSNVVNSFNGFTNQNNQNNENSLNDPSKYQIANASPQTPRKQPPKAPPKTNKARVRNYLLSLRLSKPKTTEELWQDVKFLKNLFQYFVPIEKTRLAQVSFTFIFLVLRIF